MSVHSANSLFEMNIKGAENCLELFESIRKFRRRKQDSWVLRAAVVFAVSALDTYFHDKVRYRVGRFSLENLRPELGKFEIPIRESTSWDGADRKGNVLRNWVVDYLGTKPLQRRQAIADALKLAGIDSLWNTIEPNNRDRNALLDEMDLLIARRSQIAHEGDRQTARSRKALRPITPEQVRCWIEFTRTLVARIEKAFPR